MERSLQVSTEEVGVCIVGEPAGVDDKPLAVLNQSAIGRNLVTVAHEREGQPAGPLRGSPTVAFNAVYVMTQDNQIYAVRMSDGESQP